VALIAGIAAKEVVVSSMSVLFGISNITSAAGMAELHGVLGSMGFTAVNAYSFMLFALLYVPCIATIATKKKEAGRKYAFLNALLQVCTALIVSTLFYFVATYV